jgi:hypothetical protein
MADAGVVVAVYEGYRDAEHGVRELRKAGVEMKSVSIAAKDSCTGEDVAGYYSTGDGMKYWGKTGNVWGEFWGLLSGSAVFAMPSIGSVLIAGPLVNWIVKGLEEGTVVDGISSVGLGLLSIGIPRTDVMQYEVDLKRNKFIVLVYGDPQTLAVAEGLIGKTKHLSYTVHGQRVEDRTVVSEFVA